MCEMSTCQVDYQSRVSYTYGRAWETRGVSLGLCGHAVSDNAILYFTQPFQGPLAGPETRDASLVASCRGCLCALLWAVSQEDLQHHCCRHDLPAEPYS